MTDHDPVRIPSPATRWALAALALYGALLWVTRPATPLEWDEVLALRGVEEYDVAAHAPQPPGFPAYIGAAKAVRALVGDPLVALQLVGIAAALGALAATWALARRLGAPPLAAGAAAALVAASPEFLYSAAVGISDVSGTAAGVAAALALVVAAERPAAWPLAGAACGLVLGIRPQTGAVLIPALAWALVAAARARRWGRVAAGAGTGALVAAACWVPAVLATGARRWWDATTGQVRYMATAERTLHLPDAAVAEVARRWLLDSFALPEFALPMWLLVAAGAFVLTRAGRGRLAALAGASAGCYLLSALFTMNDTVSLRYALPALPFLALLAGGGLAAPRRAVRATAAAVVALWCAAAVAWASPALRERRAPSPTWAALTWIRGHADRDTTRVVFDGVFSPHVDYVLRRAGYSAFRADRTSIMDNLQVAAEQTLFVGPLPVPGADVLFEAHHRTSRIVQLAWGRYGSCVVSRMRRSDRAVYSPEWQLTRNGWRLSGTGQIALPSSSTPAIVRLCAGPQAITLRRPGAAVETIAPHACVVARLAPGPGGALAVSSPQDSAALLPPIDFLPISAAEPEAETASAYLVPQAAHRQGFGGAFWRTDLVMINPNRHPVNVAVRFLPTGQDNASAPVITGTLAAGELRTVPDVLAVKEFEPAGTLGALLVYATDDSVACAGRACDLIVLARTFGTPLSVWRPEEWMAGVAPAKALRSGDTAVISRVTSGGEFRTGFGCASWSERPARVVVRVLDAAGATLEAEQLEVPRFGHVYIPVHATVTDGRVEVAVAAAAGALVVPYVSMVDRRTGLPTHLLPDALPAHPVPDGWAPPLPGTAVQVAEARRGR